MEPDKIATVLFELGAVKFGEFTLSSGAKSPYYIDMRTVLGSPVSFRRIIGSLLDSIEEGPGLDSFDAIASVPTGGLVFASALAFESVKPLAYVRNSTKEHGTQRSVEGALSPGDRVLIVDDVATTGRSVIRAAQELEKIGAKVSGSLVVVDRMEGASASLEKAGVKLWSAATIAEIGEALHKQKKIDDSMIAAIRARTNAA